METLSGDLKHGDGAACVACQRALGGYTNPLTGSARIDGTAYLVREREPEKSSLAFEDIHDGRELGHLCDLAAKALARSHAQAPGNAEAIQGWVKDDVRKAVRRLVHFARQYADQTRTDLRAFREATV
jgi:hypothetical protein